MVAKPCTRAGRRVRRIHVWRGATRVSWWWRGKWRGIGLPVWELFSFSGPYPVLLRTGGERAMPVKPSVRTGDSVPVGASRGAWLETLPELSDWLCRSTYEDGSLIGAVQLQIRREGSVIRATLKIADQGGLKVSAIEASPMDALLALDLLLSGKDVPWEEDAYPLGNKSSKKK